MGAIADTVLISGRGIPPTLLALLAAAAAAVVIGGYRRALGIRDYGFWVPWAMLALRTSAIGLLVLLVVDPILRVQHAPVGSQRIAVLVDTSRSMAIRDSVSGDSRASVASKILSSEKLLDRLGILCKTELLAFDSDLRPLDPGPLAPSGDASNLSLAICRVRETKDPASLSAIVILTDGCETGARSISDLAPGAPVYPIGLGSIDVAIAQMPDVVLSGVKVDRQALLNSRVEVKVELRETLLDGERATVQVIRNEKVLAQQSVLLAKGGQEVPLYFTPTEPGLFEYEARVLPHPKERIAENNSRFFALRVAPRKIRVFYYEGTPRWTYKFLTRELKRDASIALQAVLRTNTDRAYQSSTATTETAVFPAGREALKQYDCVILGDIRGQDLTSEQAGALREYIGEDGGGLILLGGKESLSPGGLPALGLDPLLPASLGNVRQVSGSFAVRATPEGVTHPVLAGIGRFLPIDSLFVLGTLKPGAQLLARAEGDQEAFPLAVAHRYGSGRVFLCACDSEWKWVMKYKDQSGDALYVRFWGQVVRWAANRNAATGPQNALNTATDKEIYRLGEAVKIRVQGASLDGIAEALVGSEKVPLQKSLDRLEGAFFPKNPGLFKVTVGDSSCDFFVERSAGELDRIALNEPLLRQVASASGGQYFDATSARSLPEALKTSGKLKVETMEYILGESWIAFALVLLTLGAEWVLRKRMQVM